MLFQLLASFDTSASPANGGEVNSKTVLTDTRCCDIVQGSLAPQNAEIYLQLKTEYLKMVPHPLLAAVAASVSRRVWLIMQEVLFALGPQVYWSQRRTLLVIRTIETQTAWLDSICLVSPGLPC